MNSTIYILRCVVLITFMVGMPLLALPPVADSAGSVFGQLMRATGTGFEIAVYSPTQSFDNDFDQPNLASAPRGAAQNDLIRQASAEVIVATQADEDLAAKMAKVSRQLESRGSTDFALEQVSAEDSQFRFACRVPLRAGSPYSKPFEAIDSDPYAAMKLVLARVEEWHNAQTAANDR